MGEREEARFRIRPATLEDTPLLARHRAAMFRDMGQLSADSEPALVDATKKLRSPESASSTPVKPCATMRAAATPFLAGMPPKSNAFSMCSSSRIQHEMPEACCAVYERR